MVYHLQQQHLRAADQQHLTSPNGTADPPGRNRQNHMLHRQQQQQQQQHPQLRDSERRRRLEPVLNERIKNLHNNNGSLNGGGVSRSVSNSPSPGSVSTASTANVGSNGSGSNGNFSLRPRDDESHRVVVTRTRECRLVKTNLVK